MRPDRSSSSLREFILAADVCRGISFYGGYHGRHSSLQRPLSLGRYCQQCLGALIVLTAWMVGDVGSQTVAANATIVGILVVALGASEFLDLRRWEEVLETACGLWLIASPFIFGYADAGMLRYWHFVLGAAVVLLAMFELRQDWTLSNAEFTQHSAR